MCPKRCTYNNEDEDNSPNILTDKNYQASSQKLKQFLKLLNLTTSNQYHLVIASTVNNLRSAREVGNVLSWEMRMFLFVCMGFMAIQPL